MVNDSNVVDFKERRESKLNRDSDCWQCGCGHCGFIIHRSGKVECGKCGTLTKLVQCVFWDAELPVNTPNAQAKRHGDDQTGAKP